MASKIKVDQIQTADGTGTIALQNQLSGMTTASLPALSSAQMPTGSVLQVVSSSTVPGHVSTTSTSFIDSGIYADITPTSTSSKIYVSFDIGMTFVDASSLRLAIARGTSTLQTSTYGHYIEPKTAATYQPAFISLIDSPSTTSATRYSLYFRTGNSSAQNYCSHTGSTTSIVLMEIAG